MVCAPTDQFVHLQELLQQEFAKKVSMKTVVGLGFRVIKRLRAELKGLELRGSRVLKALTVKVNLDYLACWSAATHLDSKLTSCVLQAYTHQVSSLFASLHAGHSCTALLLIAADHSWLARGRQARHFSCCRRASCCWQCCQAQSSTCSTTRIRASSKPGRPSRARTLTSPRTGLSTRLQRWSCGSRLLSRHACLGLHTTFSVHGLAVQSLCVLSRHLSVRLSTLLCVHMQPPCRVAAIASLLSLLGCDFCLLQLKLQQPVVDCVALHLRYGLLPALQAGCGLPDLSLVGGSLGQSSVQRTLKSWATGCPALTGSSFVSKAAFPAVWEAQVGLRLAPHLLRPVQLPAVCLQPAASSPFSFACQVSLFCCLHSLPAADTVLCICPGCTRPARWRADATRAG